MALVAGGPAGGSERSGWTGLRTGCSGRSILSEDQSNRIARSLRPDLPQRAPRAGRQTPRECLPEAIARRVGLPSVEERPLDPKAAFDLPEARGAKVENEGTSILWQKKGISAGLDHEVAGETPIHHWTTPQTRLETVLCTQLP